MQRDIRQSRPVRRGLLHINHQFLRQRWIKGFVMKILYEVHHLPGVELFRQGNPGIIINGRFGLCR